MTGPFHRRTRLHSSTLPEEVRDTRNCSGRKVFNQLSFDFRSYFRCCFLQEIVVCIVMIVGLTCAGLARNIFPQFILAIALTSVHTWQWSLCRSGAEKPVSPQTYYFKKGFMINIFFSVHQDG